jgi:hypothetical protein
MIKTKAESLAWLREQLPVGSTVYGIVAHRSESGMTRTIKHYAIVDGRMAWLSWHVANVLESVTFDPKRDGCKIRGCGMDMAAHIVRNLSRELHGGEYDLRSDLL